ncbi:MAG: fluoride efflux transporter CrcB [Gammaproteobacteria bacterium]|nr:fluoride efflux transporter CrcB [Gammaproteobacteria bacterium]MDH5730200.1 fluoride efflux transporter CrcB [Gammaproteobacteria bacterium]
MKHIIAIAAGGALGAVLRFWSAQAVQTAVAKHFPFGTLFVNVSGSLLMGVLYVVLVERGLLNDEWRAFLTIGMLGAFTTFSTFSIETVSLLTAGEWFKAMTNMILSVVLCVGAAWCGLVLARQFS